MRRVLTFVGRAVATAVIIVGAAALLVGVLVPRLAGATPYTVQSASMAPTYPLGTLVVVRPSDSIALGDVITYQLASGRPEVATHRVVGLGFTHDGEPQYTTRGDANPVSDRSTVSSVQVRGEVWYAVPYLGYVSAAATGEQRQAAAVGVAVLLVVYAGWQVIRARQERQQRTRPEGRDTRPEPSGTEGRRSERPEGVGAA